MQKTVANIIDEKGHETWSIGVDASVYEALEEMAVRNVGALLVMADGELRGILSERDYARKVILVDRGSRETMVSEIMTSDLVTVSSTTTVASCMQLMTDARIRHLPVVDDGRLVGVISIGDVVRAVIDEQKFLIDQLEGYIKG
ncbi:CBS domain protein [hydrothermal vent metagenome]|uniref:CBS domain protein n=1 Tax=hydrothermal vent metagenome TaxID=652676 RepID=A0A3B0T3X0_9ZZZZ